MNHYTVLLLRPDYLADDFGKDTYLARVTANGATEAMEQAQCEACAEDSAGAGAGDPNDYYVLFATMGHLRDMSRDGE